MLNQLQHEILTGLMLGDGFLDKEHKNARLRVERVNTDEEYLMYHKEIFKEFVTDKGVSQREHFDKRTNKIYYSTIFRTKVSEEFTEYHNKWYKNKVKIVPKDLVLTPTVIATWLADDGGVYPNYQNGKLYDRIQISTDGFSKIEIQFLKELLDERYKINTLINKHKSKFVLAICKKDSIVKIINDINNYFPNSMKRKSDKWQHLLLNNKDAK